MLLNAIAFVHVHCALMVTVTTFDKNVDFEMTTRTNKCFRSLTAFIVHSLITNALS